MADQLELFTYGEALDLTEAHFLTLDVLYHRWRSLDPQFWLDTPRTSGAKAHADALKQGMSEWYPIEKLPPSALDRAALEDLTARGWIEVGKHRYWTLGEVACVRITYAGLDAWKRHERACFEAGLKAHDGHPASRRRKVLR